MSRLSRFTFLYGSFLGPSDTVEYEGLELLTEFVCPICFYCISDYFFNQFNNIIYYNHFIFIVYVKARMQNNTSTGLCKYKHIFGKEGQGFHKQRFLGVAIYDTLGTIIVAWLISIAFDLNFLTTMVSAFIIGIIMHRIFCVNTTINKLIFGKVA
jgi:hypothetical protein